MSNNTQDLTSANVDEFLNGIDDFVFDCDGVLWTGKHAIKGAEKTLEYLRESGKRVFFVTNNSSKSRETYVISMKKFGIIAKKEEIMGSAFAAAAYLKNKNFDKKVYVLGGPGIYEELKEAGIETVDNESHNGIHTFEEVEDIQVDKEVGAVVCGFDVNTCYYKLAYAHKALRGNEDKVEFIATNLDSTFPGSNGIYPGGGSIVAPLSTALGRQPIVMGKPEPLMLDILIKNFGLKPEKSCMVGDRLNTDIAFGKQGGLKTLLVLTGITQREDLKDPEQKVHPDFIIPSLGDLPGLSSK